ncbi:hypothetical protein ABZ615_24030 [Streptomyces sp. NPDC007325]|uniref:hypothetical protein n=1 Tax=Streptomyces sp. NPDC007325 TaxID=3154588 RepID=UPI00340EF451
MSDLSWVPQSCALPTEGQPLRVAEWDALFAERLASSARPEPLRLRLGLISGPGVERRVRELAAREAACCSFFAFTVTLGDALTFLDIVVDPAHEAVLDALSARTAAHGAR